MQNDEPPDMEVRAVERDYHSPKPPSKLKLPDVILAPLQKQRILDALQSPTVATAESYQHQCFILCSQLHDVDIYHMEDNDQDESHQRMQVSYELIGKCFDPVRTHTAIILANGWHIS